jgi:PKD repeat protein
MLTIRIKIYLINSVPKPMGNVPTPGSKYSFIVDIPNNDFIVPLGIVRSGVTLPNNVNINISASNDTVAELIDNGIISSATSILPDDKFTLDSYTIIPSGKTSALFNIHMDLDFLVAFPDTSFALGVNISSEDIAVKSSLKTTVIVIETKMLTPVAGFTYTVSPDDKSKYNFKSTSENATKLKWDFGDGSAVDTINESPAHFYAKSKSYIVTLTATGILGDFNPSIKQSVVKVVLKPTANFTYTADAADSKKITFTNTSKLALTYSWDFGDGSALSAEKDPIHIYPAAGNYNVKLTAIGDTGDKDKSIKTIVVKVL